MRRIVLSVAVVAAVLAGASRAHAQSSMDAFHGYFTAQAGWASGGDVTSPVFMPGMAVSVQEYNGWGAEFDFSYAADADSGLQELDLATYMFNGSYIQPRGRWRPFVSAGVGIMQIDGCNTPCNRAAQTYDLGINGGGGLLYTVNDVVAARGDLRYFKSFAEHPDLQRPDGFGFFRLSIGVTFMWTILP